MLKIHNFLSLQLFATIVTILINFFITVLIANKLQLYNFGLYTVLFTFASLASIFFNFLNIPIDDVDAPVYGIVLTEFNLSILLTYFLLRE